MSSTSEVAGDRSNVPKRDWRDHMLRIRERHGFYRHVIVPEPPARPTGRAVVQSSAHDYQTEQLPWESEADKQEAENFARFEAGLVDRYGRGNVVIAYPTAKMELEHPEYAERPHVMFMVRPPENVPDREDMVMFLARLGRTAPPKTE